MTKNLIISVTVLSLMCFAPGFVFAETHPSFPVTPKTNNGKKWRIGYVEGGPYENYQDRLKVLVESLADLGWMEKTPFPKPADKKETGTFWTWLAKDVKSDYLEFVADAYWSAGWNNISRNEIRETVIARLKMEKDIDLMLAFGTWAGQDLANTRHSVPTMVLSVSDPIEAGIIKSVEDSGHDHIFSHADPKRNERQIRLFHEIIKFKKLGIVYQDTPSAKTYAALEDVKRFAKEFGFDLVECAAPVDLVHNAPEAEEKRLIECCQKIAPQIDAFYLTLNTAVNQRSIPKMLEPFFKHKVPTFAQGRTGEVKQGVLMSLAQQDFKTEGKFFATSFAQILNGAKPRSLPQLLEDSQEIAINLETARRIGFRFPVEIIAGAKEIRNQIENR